MEDNIKRKVCLAIERVIASDIEKNEKLSEIIDSIMFVSIIIEIEQEFNIEIPNEYLNIEMFECVENIVNAVTKVIEVNKCVS